MTISLTQFVLTLWGGCASFFLLKFISLLVVAHAGIVAGNNVEEVVNQLQTNVWALSVTVTGILFFVLGFYG